MESTAFEVWVSGIGVLSEAQRRHAWQALALCEASDPGSADLDVPSEARHSSLDQATSVAPAKRLPGRSLLGNCTPRSTATWASM